MITKEQWDEIEKSLRHAVFPLVRLRYAGRQLTIRKESYSENRQVLVVYIDGGFMLGWGDPRSKLFDPFVQDVWRHRRRPVWSPKEKARMEKTFGKRKAREHFPKLDQVVEHYAPFFNTAGPLVRKLRRLDGIEEVPPAEGDSTLSPIGVVL